MSAFQSRLDVYCSQSPPAVIDSLEQEEAKCASLVKAFSDFAKNNHKLEKFEEMQRALTENCELLPSEKDVPFDNIPEMSSPGKESAVRPV